MIWLRVSEVQASCTMTEKNPVANASTIPE
jgi:hypothetical protein